MKFVQYQLNQLDKYTNLKCIYKTGDISIYVSMLSIIKGLMFIDEM